MENVLAQVKTKKGQVAAPVGVSGVSVLPAAGLLTPGLTSPFSLPGLGLPGGQEPTSLPGPAAPAGLPGPAGAAPVGGAEKR